jgi:hypothetical protein
MSLPEKEPALRTAVVLGTVVRFRGERGQARWAGRLHGVEIDYQVGRIAFCVAESLVVEELQNRSSAFDFVARDREQDSCASRTTSPGRLHRRGRQAVVPAEFLQFSNLIEVALVERDQCAVLHGAQSVESIDAAVNSRELDYLSVFAAFAFRFLARF